MDHEDRVGDDSRGFESPVEVSLFEDPSNQEFLKLIANAKIMD